MRSIREVIADLDTEFLMLEPAEDYDHCVIGIARQAGREDCVAYDVDAVITALVQQGMNWEEAEEFFDFNIAGAYMGERAPIFIECLNRTAPLRGGGEGLETRAALSADVVTAAN